MPANLLNNNVELIAGIILSSLKTDNDKNEVVEYVLGKPSLDDKKIIHQSIEIMLSEIDAFFNGESTKLMNKLNGENR